MKIFFFKVRISEKFWLNFLPRIFFSLALLTFYMASVSSNNFEFYRFKYSLIPSESSLIRSGPYVMSELRTRNSLLIKLKSNNGLEDYYEDSVNFIDTNNILNIVSKNNSTKSVFLWLCDCQTSRKIWKIDFYNKTILSYDRAVQIYKIDFSPTFYLRLSLIYLFSFVLSIFNFFYVGFKFNTNNLKD